MNIRNLSFELWLIVLIWLVIRECGFIIIVNIVYFWSYVIFYVVLCEFEDVSWE